MKRKRKNSLFSLCVILNLITLHHYEIIMKLSAMVMSFMFVTTRQSNDMTLGVVIDVIIYKKRRSTIKREFKKEIIYHLNLRETLRLVCDFSLKK